MRADLVIDEHHSDTFRLGDGRLVLTVRDEEPRDFDWKDQLLVASLSSPSIASREAFLEGLARQWKVSLSPEGRKAPCTSATVAVSPATDEPKGMTRTLWLGGPRAPALLIDWKDDRASFSNPRPDARSVLSQLASLLREGGGRHVRQGFSAPIDPRVPTPRVEAFTPLLELPAATALSWVARIDEHAVVIAHGPRPALLAVPLDGGPPSILCAPEREVRRAFVHRVEPLHAVVLEAVSGSRVEVWALGDDGASKVKVRQGQYELPIRCPALSPDGRWLVLSCLEKNAKGPRRHHELVLVDLHGEKKPTTLAVGEASLEAVRWTKESLDFEAPHDPWLGDSEPRRCFRFDLRDGSSAPVDEWPTSEGVRSPDGQRLAVVGERTPQNLQADRVLHLRSADQSTSSSHAFPRSLGAVSWAGSRFLLIDGTTVLDAETGALCELDVDGEVLEFDREGARIFIMRDTTLGVSDVTWT